MGFKINSISEFQDKRTEALFMAGEYKKSLKLARYLVLLSSLAILLMASAPFLGDFPITILTYYDIGSRVIIFAMGVALFFVLPKVKNVSLVSILVCSFAAFIYADHILVFFSFGTMPIIFETFNVIILSTSLFLLPNRWVINLAFSVLFFLVYLIVTPYICLNTIVSDRILTAVYAFWNILLVSILFHRINLHKRQSFAKEYQLEELVKTDHLTKIPNRKACDEFLESSCKENAATSCIMFDIDDFKNINDTYGHLIGDKVILGIIETAKKNIRENDIIARWGGEEFVIIMPGTGLQTAAEIARRVREQLSLVKHEHIKETITCSFGVTTLTAGDTPGTVIKRVDELLYLAKAYGKNRVVPG
jgi:diguanylate cyclase (GGDEF)-like protein